MEEINVIPSKHIFDALIQDIDENRAICDLIDNAIDNWKINKPKKYLKIEIAVAKRAFKSYGC